MQSERSFGLSLGTLKPKTLLPKMNLYVELDEQNRTSKQSENSF